MIGMEFRARSRSQHAMANQELFKLENAVRKAESAWDRQMKRDGHLKKESRDISSVDPSRMSPTARAFYHEYAAAKSALDAEAGHTNLFGGTPADPHDDDEPDTPAPAYPRPEEVWTPDDVERRIVSPKALEGFKKANGKMKFDAKTPNAVLVPLDNREWLPWYVGDGYVLLQVAVPESSFMGDTHQAIPEETGEVHADAGARAGFLFRGGAVKNAPSYVLQAELLAVVAGDPVAATELS